MDAIESRLRVGPLVPPFQVPPKGAALVSLSVDRVAPHAREFTALAADVATTLLAAPRRLLETADALGETEPPPRPRRP